jgi:hypothetical protein
MTFTVKWLGDGVARAVREAHKKGLTDAAEHILEESNRVIPHDEGTLMRSGSVDVDETMGEASISYDTPYAARQHEDQTLSHPNGRKAKFLESALKERSDAAVEFYKKAIEGALKG